MANRLLLVALRAKPPFREGQRVALVVYDVSEKNPQNDETAAAVHVADLSGTVIVAQDDPRVAFELAFQDGSMEEWQRWLRAPGARESNTLRDL